MVYHADDVLTELVAALRGSASLNDMYTVYIVMHMVRGGWDFRLAAVSGAYRGPIASCVTVNVKV